MKRFVLVLSLMAVMGMMLAAMAVPALAKGPPQGFPDESCQGQINSIENTRYETNPKEAADFLSQRGLSTGNPGDYEKQIRKGDFGTFDPEVGFVFCPLTP